MRQQTDLFIARIRLIFRNSISRRQHDASTPSQLNTIEKPWPGLAARARIESDKCQGDLLRYTLDTRLPRTPGGGARGCWLVGCGVAVGWMARCCCCCRRQNDIAQSPSHQRNQPTNQQQHIEINRTHHRQKRSPGTIYDDDGAVYNNVCDMQNA